MCAITKLPQRVPAQEGKTNVLYVVYQQANLDHPVLRMPFTIIITQAFIRSSGSPAMSTVVDL